MLSSTAPAPIVGLTGGIGSGKSTVSQKLAELGACVIDSDIIAREVVAKGSKGLAMVVERFGELVLANDGSLDRAKLASTVFSDPAALGNLNGILHPLIEAETKEQVIECISCGKIPVIIVIPLLFETNAAKRYGLSKVIVVDLPEDQAVQRVVASRDMSEEEVRSRIAAQASRQERLAGADYVIDNSVDPETLQQQVIDLWKELKTIY
ncbi:MAG: dephospho-CoA kinase [Actinomycetota bacterium]|nr:MAG: dephospho-CoA kinase [Actinomycetota bacterium]